ncbi:hypothetical protein HYW30_00290 [Candidatus Azambacteria bacterium]|nr:hypothetical protein [Candidatus Azambacteria bacterium]
MSQPAPTVETPQPAPEEKAPALLDFLKRKPVQNEQNIEAAKEPQQLSGEIQVKAEAGEGVTHLARRALKQFLEENKTGENLTKEHKIYIEDWLKDKKGSRPLKLGEEIGFLKSDIQAAIDASLNLNQKQLDGLKVWSERVASL